MWSPGYGRVTGREPTARREPSSLLAGNQKGIGDLGKESFSKELWIEVTL